MEIEYDPKKDAANIAKHGVSLALAASFDWPMVLSYPDARADYKELREIGFYPVDGRLYCFTFTQRGQKMRMISLRKANNREIDEYERQA